MFVHSSISGHLGSFHLLAIMNNAALNTDRQIPVQIPTLVGIAGSNVFCILIFFFFWRIIIQCSTQTVPFYVTTSNTQGFPFLREWIFACEKDDAFKLASQNNAKTWVFARRIFSSFLKIFSFFGCGPFLKSLLNLLQYCFIYFWGVSSRRSCRTS